MPSHSISEQGTANNLIVTFVDLLDGLDEESDLALMLAEWKELLELTYPLDEQPA